MFADYREPLVEVAAQLLVVLLDHETMQQAAATMNGTDNEHAFEVHVHVSCSRPLHAERVCFQTFACKGSLSTTVIISYPECAYK